MAIERFHYEKSSLSIGLYKSIPTDVYLQIKTRNNDEYSDEIENPNDFIDGIQAVGQLSFETYLGCNRLKQDTLGSLTLYEDGRSTNINVILIEKNNEVVLEERIKRYFWMFFVIGKPAYDGLEIFPKWYRSGVVNKVFTCVDFKGIWPIGVASVVVAENKKEAKRLLLNALLEAKIDQPEVKDLTLQELDLTTSHAVILNNGDY